MQTVMVQVKFTEETPQGRFCDALYLTPEQYASMSQQDVDALKAERVNNWKAVVTAVPVEVVKTQEDIEAEIKAIDEQIVQLDQRQAELVRKVEMMKAVGVMEKVDGD